MQENGIKIRFGQAEYFPILLSDGRGISRLILEQGHLAYEFTDCPLGDAVFAEKLAPVYADKSGGNYVEMLAFFPLLDNCFPLLERFLLKGTYQDVHLMELEVFKEMDLF